MCDSYDNEFEESLLICYISDLLILINAFINNESYTGSGKIIYLPNTNRC